MILGAVTALMSGAGIANTILGLFPPLSTAYTQWSYSMWPNMIPGVGDLIEMFHRGEISENEYQVAAERLGYGSTWSMRLYEAGKRFLNAADYVAIWRRGKIDEITLNKRLEHLRFSEESIDEIKQATEFFPQPQDLVRFAVREVYTPETVAKFGQMEDLPPQFLVEAAKVGIPPEQARNFWGAHWDLPSPNQGFEMFQRDVIDEPTLHMLLKALDIMPFWRDQLTKIAYRTLTRVDIRRMHSMGVMSDIQTYDAYRFMGYSPDNADLMLKFTKEYNQSDNKVLTRGMVMSAFKIDMMSSAELLGDLMEMGYPIEDAAYQISIAQYDKDLADVEDTKSEYEAQVNAGQLSTGEYRIKLDGMALPSTYVDRAVKKAELKTAEKTKLPSRADIERWLKLGVIDEIGYVDAMRALNYRQEDIERYLTEIALEQDTTVRKYLTTGTYVRWFSTGIINETSFVRILTEKDISGADINRYIQEVEAGNAAD